MNSLTHWHVYLKVLVIGYVPHWVPQFHLISLNELLDLFHQQFCFHLSLLYPAFIYSRGFTDMVGHKGIY
jgi:hypothetical protein